MVNIKGAIAGIIAFVVVLVIVFTFISNSTGDLTRATDSVTDANNCSDGTDTEGTTLKYNASNGYCYNTSAGNDTQMYLAEQYDLPLNSLFGSSGMLMMIMMASILLLIIGISLKFKLKK